MGLNCSTDDKLHHRLDLAFEEDRQHDDVRGRRFAKTRADLDVILRHIREEDALLLERGLADQSFAETEAIVHAFAFAIRVAREQSFSSGSSARAVHDIEDALLRGNDRRQLRQESCGPP